jgi:hypothetical protein
VDYENSTAVWKIDTLALIALHRVADLYHRAGAKEEQVRL